MLSSTPQMLHERFVKHLLPLCLSSLEASVITRFKPFDFGIDPKEEGTGTKMYNMDYLTMVCGA